MSKKKNHSFQLGFECDIEASVHSQRVPVFSVKGTSISSVIRLHLGWQRIIIRMNTFYVMDETSVVRDSPSKARPAMSSGEKRGLLTRESTPSTSMGGIGKKFPRFSFDPNVLYMPHASWKPFSPLCLCRKIISKHPFPYMYISNSFCTYRNIENTT